MVGWTKGRLSGALGYAENGLCSFLLSVERPEVERAAPKGLAKTLPLGVMIAFTDATFFIGC
jgi:hypothetical protein